MAYRARVDDRIDVGLWEFVTYELSVAAGIDLPEFLGKVSAEGAKKPGEK